MTYPVEIAAKDIHTALEIYLEHAYLGGEVPQRARAMVPSREAELDRVLACFSDETTRNRGHIQRWVLRLGNHKYPFMKLVLQEHFLPGRFFFSVDTHDQFVIQPHFPDLGGWNALKERNRQLRERIEAHWRRAGLPTSEQLREEFMREYGARSTSGSGLEIRARILLADDDCDLCVCLAAFLRGERFEVIETYDGESAAQLFESEHPDLLILDFEMPGNSGLELTRRVRALRDARRGIPILMTSLAELPPSRLSEVTAFLPKPFSLAQIRELVEEHLES